ncbi:5'-nucleotidase C-terminal domain-containing protein [Clostridium carnis]
MLKKRIIALATAFSLVFGLGSTPIITYANENVIVEQQEGNTEKKETLQNEEVQKEEIQKEEVSLTETSNEKTTIQILSTTDLHGKFKNYDYASNSKSDGGLNQIATIIKEEKVKNPNTIVVDNGDTIQGNYNHLFLTEEYLNNNVNPMVLGMTEIGYDVFSLGNHEFNYGMNVLNKLVKQYEDRGTAIIAANFYKDKERVFKPYIIKEVDGVKVAVIGVVTNHITKWDADKLIGYEATNPAEEVKKVIGEIKAKNEADIFVVSAHMGLNQEHGDGDSAKDIANLNPEVAMILAGHSHTSILSEIVNGVLITQPKNNGQEVSKVELEIEKNNGQAKVINKKASHIKVDKTIAEDEALNQKLDVYHNAAIADAKKVIGRLEGNNLAEENEVKGVPQSFVSDQGVTDLINEVQLHYSAKHLESLGIDSKNVYHLSGAAMLSSSSNLKSGDISKSDLANVYKFDNKLYTVKTTGKQIKNYLEWATRFFNTFEEGDFTVSFNKDVASFLYDMLSGVKYEINISKPEGKRIENLTFNDGKKVEDKDVVYLAINDYRYSNLMDVLDGNEFVKVYESINDTVSDVRDMIADYIENVKGGVITRSVDNNWKLTVVKYNEPLRAEVIKLINDGSLAVPLNYGIISSPITWDYVSTKLTEMGETEKLAKLKALTANRVDILSINDFHGSVLESGKNIGAAKMAGVINKYRSKANDIYSVIPVSAGDSFQGTAISNLTHGAPVIDMYKSIGLETSAIGNHEFDWDRSDFANWQKDGGFDFVAANIVYKKTGELVDFAKPYIMIERNGAKIAFIGIATTDTVTSTKADKIEDLDFLDPVETLDKWSEIARKDGANAIVALTHSGAIEEKDGSIVGEAADIAKDAKDVDAVIAAHNHRFVDGYVNGIPVVQGGYNGRGVATIRFTFDNDKNLISAEPYTHVFVGKEDILPVDAGVKALIDKHNENLGPIFAEKVAYIENKLDHDRNKGVTPLGITVSEAMRKITGTQISINNGGGIRRALEAGDITVGDMYEILPFDNTIVTLDVKGEDLVKLIEHGINPPSFGWGQYAGLKVWYDEATGKVTSMRLSDGTKIKMNEYYSVAINDFMLTGGDGYDFSNAINVVNTQIVMRDSIADEWKINGVPSLDYNLLVAGEDTTVENPEVKPEVKPETKPEVTPEAGEDKNENNQENLPNTGAVVSPIQIMVLSLGLIAVGALILKKKEDKIA